MGLEKVDRVEEVFVWIEVVSMVVVQALWFLYALDWEVVKWILRYLKGTKGHGIMLDS